MTRPLKARVTVALSHHRPEFVRPAADLMADHAAVFLEEPPSRALDEMLRGDIPIENYVAMLDTEYPEFSFRMAAALRRLFAKGIMIFGVEPYLAHLIEIHELFADGGSPADLQPDTTRKRVYLAEHAATGALLAFYEAAARGSFSQLIKTVKGFARQDARRFVLRDRLRAAELAKVIPDHSSAYVETGQMHYALWRYLRDELGTGFHVRPKFLLDLTKTPPGVNKHLYGPGDLLTLMYIFHPGSHDVRENLLAAQSLIYHRLDTKVEMSPTDEDYPHADQDMSVLARVGQLSMSDCRRLYGRIREEKPRRALNIVDHYLAGK